MPTRTRLLDAAIDVFVDAGFSNASVTDIADRAGISGPAVYKHFDGKADLLIQAARRCLDTALTDRESRPAPFDPVATARRWLADDFAAGRRLVLELHLAAGHDTDLAALLAEWHVERAGHWQSESDVSTERITAFYLLLLGLAQVGALVALDADRERLEQHVVSMVQVLFPDDPA